MNREIKFRVWSKAKSQWVENMMLLACIDGLPFAHFVEIKDDKPVVHHVLNASVLDCIIQQYTGLKDKNGKEIYEGDVIKYQYPTDEQCKERRTTNIVVITWTHESQDNHPGFKIVDLFYQHGDMEIIGNIFENPELL